MFPPLNGYLITHNKISRMDDKPNLIISEGRYPTNNVLSIKLFILGYR